MRVEKNVPEIRFAGFSGEWEEKRLGDVVTCFSGGTPLVGVEEYYKGNIPFIRSAEINKATTELTISESGLKNSSAKIIEVGTVLYALYGATSGEVGRAKLSGAINQAILAIIPMPRVCPEFLSQWLRKSKSSIVSTYLQGGQGNLSGDIVKSLVLMSPKFEEQTAIGNTFQKLDNLINQHQQKHDKLSNIKKAMLEKMFPKQGETIPEIRFKGFSGEWEEIELSDEVTFINGRAYSQEELLDKGKYTVLRVGNFYTNSSWYYSDLELGDKYYADNGDLLYTWSASFGPHIWNGDKVIYHYHIWKLELSENIDKLFLLHLLDYDRAKILSGSNGSTMIHITKSAMEAKKVFIPKKDEQNVIGNYFQKLDVLIKHHQQQITKLNNIKQACLSKMFV